MEHQESQPKPQNVPDQETSGDRRPSSCSPSSDTPKTDAAAFNDPMTEAQYVRANVARKLERKLDAALSSLAELHAALVRYEADVDGEAPSEHCRMMDRAAAILSENA